MVEHCCGRTLRMVRILSSSLNFSPAKPRRFSRIPTRSMYCLAVLSERILKKKYSVSKISTLDSVDTEYFLRSSFQSLTGLAVSSIYPKQSSSIEIIIFEIAVCERCKKLIRVSSVMSGRRTSSPVIIDQHISDISTFFMRRTHIK